MAVSVAEAPVSGATHCAAAVNLGEAPVCVTPLTGAEHTFFAAASPGTCDTTPAAAEVA